MRREGARADLPRQLVLFDLDGTLIDSEPGIMESIRHAFGAIGAPLPPYDVLRTWIGPPFYQSFPTALGDDAERVEAAIGKYREHQGLFTQIQADRVALARLPGKVRAAGHSHSMAKVRAAGWRSRKGNPPGLGPLPASPRRRSLMYTRYTSLTAPCAAGKGPASRPSGSVRTGPKPAPGSGTRSIRASTR